MSEYKLRIMAIALLLGVGYLVGAASHDGTVRAGVRQGEPAPQHFQSGSERSEVVLREIAATLGKMDARLDRMEKLAKQFVGKNSLQLTGENR